MCQPRPSDTSTISRGGGFSGGCGNDTPGSVRESWSAATCHAGRYATATSRCSGHARSPSCDTDTGAPEFRHHGQAKQQDRPPQRHDTWRAGCGESRSSGSEGGPQKPTSRNADRALRPDPYTRLPLLDGGRPLHAYVLLDLFSRFSPGWVVAETESADLAVELIIAACEAQGVNPGTLHADRGAAMTSKSLAELLIDMSIAKSHSRPRTSNDNAFSEAQFKTVKHHPTYPRRFDGINHARRWITDFMNLYNTEFYHSGIGLMTPATVHYAKTETVIAQRQATLDAAYRENPARFRNRPPKAPRNPTQVWINKPEPPPESTDQ